MADSDLVEILILRIAVYWGMFVRPLEAEERFLKGGDIIIFVF